MPGQGCAGEEPLGRRPASLASPCAARPRGGAARACSSAQRGISSRRSASGGHPHRQHVDAVVEVLAEAAGAHGRVQVGVGADDEAHVGAAVAGALAERAVAALLEHAEQAGLRLERELVDLVDEERAALGARDGARRCP